MQFEDPKSVLEAAAAKPSRGVDAHALVKRGTRLRRARYVAAVTGLAVVVAGASASLGVLGAEDRPAPDPAGDPFAYCDDSATSAAVYVRPGASKAEVAELRVELEQSPDVASVESVSGAEMLESLPGLVGDPPPAALIPDSEVIFELEAVDEGALERLAKLSGPAVAEVFVGPEAKGMECVVRSLCARPGPWEVSIFLRDGAGAEEVAGLQARLVMEPGVEKVQNVSKREAYAEFRRVYEDQRELWDTLRRHDLPASLRVRVVSETAADRIHAVTSPIVDEVRSSLDFRRRVCGEGYPFPAPTMIEDEDSSVRDVDEPVDVAPWVQADLLRADCRTGTVGLARGSVEFTDGSKWCRFVLLVENVSEVALELDPTDHMLWATNGNAFTPWEESTDEMFSDRLFGTPLAPGEKAMGQIVFLLDPDAIPASLELVGPDATRPVSFVLEYDCAADLRDEPRRRCFFSPDARVGEEGTIEVTLYHCGVDPIAFAGRQWVVPDPPFDATNAPRGFSGGGRIEVTSETTARYVDSSGIALHFEAADSWEPPPCE